MNEHIFAESPSGLRFIGDFDALYLSDADPWEQSAREGAMARYYEHSRSRLIDVMSELLRPGEKGLEVGCGHGCLTGRLNSYFRMTGMDVSRFAIIEAKRQHTGVYVQGDIVADVFQSFGPFRFVLWGQMLWYVLHEIDKAVENSLRCLEPGGLFIVSQAFLVDQRYGKEIADGFDGAMRLFLDDDRLRLIHANYDDALRYVHHDGLLVFRKI